MYLFWALVTALFAVTSEVLFKRGIGWPDYWWLFIPLAVAINYGVFRTVTAGPTLLLSIVAFALCTLTLRSLASQFLLGETLTKGNLVAVMALVTAVVVGHIWR